jgi:hypothetical protein
MLLTYKKSRKRRPYIISVYNGLALTAFYSAKPTPFILAECLLDNIAELTDIADIYRINSASPIL